MSTPPLTASFIDRRDPLSADNSPTVERRQFADSHEALSPAARELAQGIESYKIQNRRRFITYEEMLQVIQELGYSK